MKSCTYQRRSVLDTGASEVMTLAIHPNAKELAIGTEDGRLWEWSIDTERWVHQRAFGTPIWSIGWLPDETTLAFTTFDGGMYAWGTEQQRPHSILKHTSRFYWSQFLGAAREVALPSSDRTVQQRRLPSGRLIRVLRSHAGEVNMVAYSPEGRHLASVSDDQTVRLFERKTGRPAWRSTGLFASKGHVLTHEGWFDLKAGHRIAETSTSARWKKILQTRAQTVAEGAGHLCVYTYDGALKIWKLDSDRLLHTLPVSPLEDLTTTGFGCVWRSQGAVRGVKLDDLDAPYTWWAEGVVALGASSDEIAVATESHVMVFDHTGALRMRHPVEDTVSALSPGPTIVTVGFQGATWD